MPPWEWPTRSAFGGAGGGEHLVDEDVELLGRLVDRAEAVEERHAGELAVVEGEDAVAAVHQIGREAEPVVDGVAEGAVDEDDGAGVGGGGLAGVVVPAAAAERRLRRPRPRSAVGATSGGDGEEQGGERAACA